MGDKDEDKGEKPATARRVRPTADRVKEKDRIRPPTIDLKSMMAPDPSQLPPEPAKPPPPPPSEPPPAPENP